MIVDPFDAGGVAVLEFEDDSPVGSDRDGPVAFAISLALVQTVAWEIERLGCAGDVEAGQNSLHDIDQIRQDAAAVSFFVKTL